MSTDSCVSEMAHTHTFKPRNWRRRTFTGSTVAVLWGSLSPSATNNNLPPQIPALATPSPQLSSTCPCAGRGL